MSGRSGNYISGSMGPGLLALVIAAALLSGCSGRDMHRVKGRDMPEHYYPTHEKRVEMPPGSLWNSAERWGGLFHDDRARDINDLVTIRVVESARGSKSANTDTERSATEDRALNSFLGLPLNFNMTDFLGTGASFSPEIEAETSNVYKGKGTTDRDGSLTATITAKVAEILPNGNFVLEARKETLINNENQKTRTRKTRFHSVRPLLNHHVDGGQRGRSANWFRNRNTGVVTSGSGCRPRKSVGTGQEADRCSAQRWSADDSNCVLFIRIGGVHV